MKKFIITNAIVIIMISVFLVGYTGSLQCPVYADDTTDAWTQVTTNQQLVEAFKYYCKSRDLTIEGSVADAVTNFTTKTFNGLCNTLGINVTALQANLKYTTDGNLGTRFLFNTVSMNAFNQIFAQFLQDNDLSVGDEDVNKLASSEKYFTDYDGNTCAVYIVDSALNSASDPHSNGSNYIRQYGSKYIYNSNELYNLYTNGTRNLTFHLIDSTNTNCSLGYRDRYGLYWTINSTYSVEYRRRPSGSYDYIWDGDLCIVYGRNDGNYYLGVCVHVTRDYGSASNYYYIKRLTNNLSANNNVQDANVYIVSNVINNNIYNNNYTIIYPDGSTRGDDGDTEPSPSTPPSGGDDTPNYNPYPDGGGTTSPSGNVGGNGSDGTINFPDFNINLPEINWSLGDLSHKFPFSIPFDMIAFLTLLNGEPQAPHITGTIPLTSHYTWELDLDFSQFDTFAGIMRGLEFVGFMFFLISATINIVRG